MLDKQSKKKERFDLIKPHYYRMHDIVKFYGKCSEEELNALKYYKSVGVYFMTAYLLNEKLPDNLKQIPFPKFQYNYVNTCLNIKTPNDTDIPISNVKEYIEDYINLQIKQIRIMDGLFAKKDITKLNEQIILYRGMECNGKDTMKVNDTFTFKNFISTSLDRTISEMFLSSYNVYTGKHKCLFVLKNLKDIPYLYLQPYMGTFQVKPTAMLETVSPEYEMFEYILPRGIQVKITDVKEEYATDNLFNWMLSYDKLDKIFKKDYDPKAIPSLFVKYIVYYCDVTGIMEAPPVNDYNIKFTDEFKFRIPLKMID